MKRLRLLIICTLLIQVMNSCGIDEHLLNKNINNTSGSIRLSRYTSIFPALGPCGFFRPEDSYEIFTPKLTGKIDCNQLYIRHFDYNTIKCTGYIEFLDSNKVNVKIYQLSNGKTKPLTVNGIHKLKVKDN